MARVSASITRSSHGVSRRQFLGTSAGVAGILAAGRAPAFAQTRELTFLSIASFVPDTDKELKRQLEEWGTKNKVKVRLDIIAHLQLQTKKAAEVQSRSGHDLTALGPGLGDADLYFDYLADLNDVATDVAPKSGGGVNPDDSLIRGKWKLLPWWQPPFPMAVRTDLLEQLNEKNPDTWEDWLRIRKNGKSHRAPLRHGHGSQRRCQRHPALDPVVVRRLLCGQGRQDDHHQLEGDASGDGFRQASLHRGHGSGGAGLGRRQQQP